MYSFVRIGLKWIILLHNNIYMWNNKHSFANSMFYMNNANVYTYCQYMYQNNVIIMNNKICISYDNSIYAN